MLSWLLSSMKIMASVSHMNQVDVDNSSKTVFCLLTHEHVRNFYPRQELLSGIVVSGIFWFLDYSDKTTARSVMIFGT